MRFKDFLEETMMDIDTSDPNAAAMAAKQAARKANMNPQRHNRAAMQKAKDERKMAQNSDSPTAALEQQIASTKERLARLTMKLQAMRK